MKSWKVLLYAPLNVLLLVVLMWTFHANSTTRDTLNHRIAVLEGVKLEMAKACADECGVKIKAARVEGYQQAQQDHEEVRRETETLVRPRCNPLVPPYFPCCGEDAMVGGITEETWPTPDEFKARHVSTGSLLTLSCAHTANQKPEQGAAWVCGRTEGRCMNSKQRAGDCSTCYVYLSSGASRHEDFVWTGHAQDEADGPWTTDGKKGVFP